MRIRKSICAVLVFCLMLGCIIVCPTTTYAATVKLNKTAIVLIPDSACKLKISGTKSKVTWKSSDKSIAKVNKSGVVIGVKKGSCKIVAIVDGKRYTCKVKVNTAMGAETTNVSITKNADKNIVVYYNAPEDIYWKCDDVGVATANWSGEWDGNKTKLVITPKGNGTTTFVISNDHNGDSVKIKVKVSCFDENKQTGGSTNATVTNNATTFGSVSGNVTYHYNKYKGYVADTNADVFLIPRDGSALYFEGSLAISSKSELADYKCYRASVDGSGNYSISHVATGSYYVVIVSHNSTSGAFFNAEDTDAFKRDIASSFLALLSQTTADYLANTISLYKYHMEAIEIYEGENTNAGYAFGYTYI